MEFEDVCVKKHTSVYSTFSKVPYHAERACRKWSLAGSEHSLYSTRLLLNRPDGIELLSFPLSSQVRWERLQWMSPSCGRVTLLWPPTFCVTFWFSNVIEFPSLILSFFGFDESVGYQREKGKKMTNSLKGTKICFVSNSTSGYLPRTQAGLWIDTWTALVTSELFTIARRWKQPTHAYRHMGSQTDCVEYYSALKRKGILAHWITQMVFGGVVLSEISQTQRTHIVWLPVAQIPTFYDVNSWRPKVELRREEHVLCGDRTSVGRRMLFQSFMRVPNGTELRTLKHFSKPPDFMLCVFLLS